MKAMTLLVGTFVLLGVGGLVTGGRAASAPAKDGKSVTLSFVGRQVEVFFQADKKPVLQLPEGKNWSSCRGRLEGLDASFFHLIEEKGDELLIPITSVAYVPADGTTAITTPK